MSKNNPYFKDYADFLSERFDGKVQKITINAGFTCPNRDGTLGRGGCAYCNNSSFSPMTGADVRSVSRQIEDGKRFFAKKYPEMRYLAYFQSYTNTYGETERLMSLYSEAISDSDVVGLIIGTRPDCMPDSLLSRLAGLNKSKTVIIEYGAESSHDSTLAAVNRCHDWATTVDAVMRTHQAGLAVGLHFILGLPGETHDMMMTTVDRASRLPIDCIKFHQLQIVRGTRLASDYLSGRQPLTLFDVDEYIDLCVEIVSRIRKDIAIERFVSQSPDNLLIAPRWGLKNYEFTHKLFNALAHK
ncbi:MAG: TIGR01212 family radical SAM protein [Muribaculaceae bacterium]|nr:TIGR01212 family radical SAM protein [Muribaculaceae bacterium]